jgi:hypothetical protein
MGDSIEEQEDEDEVWFPTEDHDEYEPASKPEIMARFSSYSNLQSSQLPPKITVIYSTRTYLTNNSQKKSPTASVPALQTNSHVYNGLQTDRTSAGEPLIDQNFYESPPTYQYQPRNLKIHTRYMRHHLPFINSKYLRFINNRRCTIIRDKKTHNYILHINNKV